MTTRRSNGRIHVPDALVDAQGRALVPRRGLGAMKVPMVPNIKLMNQSDDGVVILMLGDDLPMIGTALTADEARHLAMSLMTHADALPPAPAAEASSKPTPEGEDHAPPSA